MKIKWILILILMTGMISCCSHKVETIPSSSGLIRTPVSFSDIAELLTRLKQDQEIYISAGDLESADEISRKRLAIAEASYPPEHSQVMEALVGRLEVVKKLGYKDEYRALLLRILNLREKNLHPLDPDIEVSRVDLARVYMNEPGNLPKAVDLLETAIQARGKRGELDFPDAIPILALLAEVYMEMGKLDKAESLLNKANKISRNFEKADKGMVFSDLARLYHLKKDEEKAEKYARRAMKYNRKTATGNLGNILQDQGRGEEAISAQQDLLRNEEKRLGKDHPDLVPVLSRLGELYRKNFLLEDAKKIYERMFSIVKKKRPSDSRTLISTTVQIAVINRELENKKEAEKYYQKALEMCRDKYGEKSREYSDIMNSAMEFYRQFPRTYDRAEKLGLASLDIDMRLKEFSPLRVCRDLNDLAKLYVYGKQWKKAEDFCSRSLKYLAKFDPEDNITDWLLYNFEAHLYLFEIMDAQNRHREASEHLQAVHDLLGRRISSSARDLYTETIVFGMTLDAVEVLPGSFPAWGGSARETFGEKVENFRDQFYKGQFKESLKTLKDMIEEYKQVHMLTGSAGE
ncbi:MAG: tetratricopeptide repeat protein [Candidatus Eremiobacteraeota bacterium]|nr:tetratricopeptide repeat protein [Candidatus Eremiobacteraeota bacterium]